MFTHDDSKTAPLLERLVAAAVGCFFGFIFGVVVAIVLGRVFGVGFWIAGLPTIVLGLYGFTSPNNSRDALTEVLNPILDYFLRR